MLVSVTVPKAILFWFTRSLNDRMGKFIRSTVIKAAKFAVYDDTTTRVNSHQNPIATLAGNDVVRSSNPKL